MSSSWRVGSAFGIGIFVHWSFWLLPLMVAVSFSGEPRMAIFMVAGVLAAFGCVALHELGHALAARLYGIETEDIILTPIGGVARLRGAIDTPVAEIVVALAGPAVNVAIAVGLALLGAVVGVPMLAADPTHGSLGVPFDPVHQPFAASMLQFLFWQNVLLAVFNMVPAFPMDGGRVLRASLALFLSRLHATEVAAGLGALASAGFVALGLLGTVSGFGSPLWVVLGVALAVMGQGELAAVRAADARMRAQHMWTHAGGGFTGFAFDPRLGLWVEWSAGRPVGLRRPVAL